MTVYKRPTGQFWHYDFVLKGKRYHGSTGAKSRRKAEEVEQAKRVLAATGELDRPAARTIPTLGQAAAAWWQSKSDKKSADQMLARVNLAVSLVGREKKVNEVTFSDISLAIQKRRGILVTGADDAKRPPSNATVNRDMIATLRPTIKLADELLNDGKGPPVTFPKINWGKLALKEPKPKPRDLDAGLQEALADVLPEHMQDFARFQKRYGLRLGEMFFKPSNLDIEGARVMITERKGDDDHYMPIAEDDLPWLAARKSRAEAAKLDTIWWRPPRPNEKVPKGTLLPLTYTAAGRALSKGMTRSGAREKRGARGSHNLRHTAVMKVMRDTNGNLRAAQRLAGHSNIRSTLSYAHVLEDDLRAILDAQSRPAPTAAPPADEETGDKGLSGKKKA